MKKAAILLFKRYLGAVPLMAVMLLAGCATQPLSQIPLGSQYQEPSMGVNAASIKGSEVRSALLDNLTVFISAIDGKLVTGGRAGWNTDVKINSGSRIVTAEFIQGQFVARTDLPVDAVPGASYVVKFEFNGTVFAKTKSVDFWIIDANTGKTVSGIVRADIGVANMQMAKGTGALYVSFDRVWLAPQPAEALAAAGITEPQFPFPLESPYEGPSARASAASIRGSEIQNAWLGSSVYEKACVLSIDGKRVTTGTAGWDTDVKIDSGLRTVTVEFDSEGGTSLAQADLQLNSVPGSSYIVQFKSCNASLSLAAHIDFWIADATTGKTVTDIVHVSPLLVELEVEQAMDGKFHDPLIDAGFMGAPLTRPTLDQGGARPIATGSKYAYTEQKDSASVGVGQTLNGFFQSRSPYAGESDISIDQIDGLDVGFPPALILGLLTPSQESQQLRLWAKAGKVWISPGKHAFALTFSQNTAEQKMGPTIIFEQTGGAFSFTGSYTVGAEFAANHEYRFTASAYGDLCYVALWDETGGLATRSRVQGWWFIGKRTYTPPDDTPSPSVHIHADKKKK